MSKTKEPIAIIGIGCRLPGDANTPEEFWSLLLNKTDAICKIPEDRWDADSYYHPDFHNSAKLNVKHGGFIKNVDKFDAAFFGVSPVEAQCMDPQQRILLEVTYEAIEDAGMDLKSLENSQTGVFMGVSGHDYSDLHAIPSERINITPHTNTGGALSIVAGRISYIFNLKGPSFIVDTACSSSSTAVHLACQSIWNNESDLALAGGVNAILRPELHLGFSIGGYLSPDGRCKSFDASGNGFVRSEGAGVIVLKPLSKALTDGDSIYALIRGSALNQDGRTNGISFPNLDSQIEMLRLAYQDANIDPGKIRYIEAHGTGTPVGDPIEAKSIGVVVGSQQSNKCLIGSVKSNIGHLESGSGVAGLIKLTLALKHRCIPPNIHFSNPNPNIPFDDLKLQVVTETTPWPDADEGMYAGVNSFGFGGSNAHIVLQGYQESAKTVEVSQEQQKLQVFTISARGETALQQHIENHLSFLQNNPQTPLQDLCYSAAMRRTHFSHRLAIVAHSTDELCQKLEAHTQQQTPEGIATGRASAAKKCAFVYSGQGPQWWAMGRELLQNDKEFRGCVEKIDTIFQEFAGWSLLEEILKDEEQSRISDTRVAQPAIFALQVALTEKWQAMGITPEAVVGHSVGEVAACYVSGIFTLREATYLIYHRSRIQAQATDKGKMLAVRLSEEDVREWLIGIEEKVSIAAINAPDLLTLAGDADVLLEMKKKLERQDIFCRELQVNVPFHSFYMDPLEQELLEALADLTPKTVTIPFYSTVSGKQHQGPELTAPYWFQNVRQTVLFTAAISKLIADDYQQFIEVGSHPILSGGVLQLLNLKNIKGIVVPSLRRKEDEQKSLFSSWCKLYVAGAEIDFGKFFAKSNYVKLPKYPFQQQTFWLETEETRKDRIGKQVHPHLQKVTRSAREPQNLIWDVKIDKRIDSYIEDHRVQGPMVYPGAGLLDISLAAAHESFPNSFCFLEDVDFKRAVFVPEEGEPLKIRLEIINDSGNYYIYSRPHDESEPWSICAEGKMRYLQDKFVSKPVNLAQMRAQITNPIDIESAYDEIEERGIKLGTTFRGMQELYTSYNGAYTAIDFSEEVLFDHDRFFIHPGILDCCFQAAVLFAGREKYTNPGKGLYIPRHVDRVKFYKRPSGTRFYTCSQRLQHTDYANIENFWIFDHNEELIAEFHGLRSQYLRGSRGELSDERNKWYYQYQWQPQSDAQTTSSSTQKTWLIYGDGQGLAEKLRGHLESSKNKVHIVQEQENVHFAPSDIHAIVYLKAMDTASNAELSCENIVAAEKQATLPLLQLVKKITQHDSQYPRLYLVTRNAQKVQKNEEVVLAQAAFRGVGRTIINEYPQIDCSLVDLSTLESNELDKFWSYLGQDKIEDEVAIRGAELYLNSLQRISPQQTLSSTQKRVEAQGYPFTTTITDRGVFDTIVLRQDKPKTPQDNEIKIQVKSASLNFRDIMLAMGLLSEESLQQTRGTHMGMECSGIVIEVGKEVTGFQKGDHVFGFFSHPLSGFATADQRHVIKMPEGENFVDAAGLSLTYTTAYYAMVHMGRLEAGEKVLIHSAAGGVGLAAVHIAQNIGAEVYATVGNDQKRDYLKSLGVKHIYNSRNLEFADQILEDTQNQGVDMVLNSLAGPAIYKSFSCLSAFGRFLEIGKTDLYRNSQIGMRSLADNISYIVVDIDKMLYQRPTFAGKMLQQASDFYYQNKLPKYPVHKYSVAEISQAFQFMASSKHIGKVIVDMQGEIDLLPPQNIEFKPNCSYLITGGCSGMGFEVAKWMVKKGANSLVLVSRSGPKNSVHQREITDLREENVNVVVAQADVTKADELQAVFNDIQANHPPLAGIIHAAMVLEDSSIATLDDAKYFQCFNPKALGCWNLHNLSKDLELDFFVSFSSVSSIYGNPGQVNYVAANSFLDEFAHFRRSQGLPALTINWGVLGEVGVVADNQELENILEQKGMYPFTVRETLQILEKMLLENPVQQAAMQIDWQRIGSINSKSKNTVRFGHLIAEAQQNSQASDSENSLRAQLQRDPENRQEILQTELRSVIIKILGTSSKLFDDHESITAMGLDSLMATQIIAWIRNNLQLDYSMMKIMRGPNLLEFTQQLLNDLQETQNTATQVTKDKQQQWVICSKKVENPRLRVFCFPYFAGGASVFAKWHESLPADIEICAIQFPGREERMAERPIDEMKVMIAETYEAIAPLLDVPYIFYSHSLGAVVSYELVLQKNLTPQHFIVGAWGAPHFQWPFMNLQNVSVEQIYDEANSEIIKKHIESLEIPQEVLSNKQLMDEMMPAIRADIVMVAKRHKFQEGTSLSCPLTAIAGENDSVFTQQQIREWQRHTQSTFSFEMIPGKHLFLRDNRKKLLQIIHNIVG